MKLEGWVDRFEAHKKMIDDMVASGKMERLHVRDPKRVSKLYRRLGQLEQKVISLTDGTDPSLFR